jgi:NAD(P)-dependent dehydrogenase (short-subunit alcohol dehydrogenase family)
VSAAQDSYRALARRALRLAADLDQLVTKAGARNADVADQDELSEWDRLFDEARAIVEEMEHPRL